MVTEDLERGLLEVMETLCFCPLILANDSDFEATFRIQESLFKKQNKKEESLFCLFS